MAVSLRPPTAVLSYYQSMTASAHDVAAAIRQRLPGVGTLKLHKLLYFCQGHHLAFANVPLFEEPIEAWDHGPVVADLWRAEKHDLVHAEVAALDNSELNTIGYVVSRYGNNTGRDLETLTHNEGPWREAFRWKKLGRSARISDVEIRRFFLDVEQADAKDDPTPFDPADVKRLLDGALQRELRPATPDTRESLLARLRG